MGLGFLNGFCAIVVVLFFVATTGGLGFLNGFCVKTFFLVFGTPDCADFLVIKLLLLKFVFFFGIPAFDFSVIIFYY